MSNIALITGSCGLIGSEAVRFFNEKKFQCVGIDNDMRSEFFGPEASTKWNLHCIKEKIPDYRHYDIDIRDNLEIDKIFKEYSSDIKIIIHTAAQPSHDWAAKDPIKDFTVNANGTLNLLEAMRSHCPDAVFIFTSTNKVYGDMPNSLKLVEDEWRWELDSSEPFYEYGIDESMSIDQSTHSVFGASKVAADVMVQEYGRYFDLKTAAFRGGCLTGPDHSGAELHGFLAYLMKCVYEKKHYKVFGYKGKQVRDNIHSYDLVNCFYEFYKNPRCGEVYNIGGSRFSNCSMMEAIKICEEITGNKLEYEYLESNRIGDHIWYISDVRKFQSHHPSWKYTKNIQDILVDIYERLKTKA